MGQGYSGSKRPTDSVDVCWTSACSDLKPYNSVNKLHMKHKKTLYLIYILAVMQLVYSLELSLSLYCTLIPAIILKWLHHLTTAVHRHAKSKTTSRPLFYLKVLRDG